MTSNADTLHSSPSQHGWWGLSSGSGDLFYFCLRLPPAPSPQQVFPGGPVLTAFPVWAAGRAAGAGELCGPLKAPLTRGELDLGPQLRALSHRAWKQPPDSS